MIIVAGGSSSRFGSDKLMSDVAGRPLITYTIDAVRRVVPHCVLVARRDQVRQLRELDLGVEVVPGGETRTASEAAGLAVVGSSELIGIHDGARPAVSAVLIERLFDVAAERGGAVPGLPPSRPLVDRASLAAVTGAIRVQTPQVFWGPELRDAYLAASSAGFTGHDTADVVRKFTNLEIEVVPGDEGNIKITYPEDLERFRDAAV